eukprot:15366957-Ditylum_brightwellii.AAC.1
MPWMSNSCITNEKRNFEINVMRVLNLDEYLGDFNSIQCDETMDNFDKVKKHYRPEGLFQRSFKDKKLAVLKKIQSGYHVLAQGLHIFRNVESLLSNGLSNCHSTLWMGSNSGRHYNNFLAFDERNKKFCHYRCYVPLGHSVMLNCFHGGSEGVSVSVANITPQLTTTGAKAIFCDMGDDFNYAVVTLQSCLAV